MTTTTEGHIDIDGKSLYTKTWTPANPIKAKLVFVHGYSDHVNRYNEWFERLCAKDIQVISWDQRGWGRSAPTKAERGLTGDTTRVCDDIAAFTKAQLPSKEPVFLMGHSMGGGEVITMASNPKYADLVKQLRGIMLHSPFIAFTPEEQPSSAKIFFGRLAGRFLPRFQLVTEVTRENISRLKSTQDSVGMDPLCHNTGTLEGLAAMLDRTQAMADGAVNMDKDVVRSLLWVHGDSDFVCSYPIAKGWFERQTVKDKTGTTIEGGYHMLHDDLCTDEFTKIVTDWLSEKSQVEPAGETEATPAAEAKL